MLVRHVRSNLGAFPTIVIGCQGVVRLSPIGLWFKYISNWISSVAQTLLCAPMQKKIPMVSVGMPVRNGAVTLGHAIESILSQTFRDFELIISDNASTDGTADVCAYYAARDPRIRYTRQIENVGASENFLAVLRMAKGPYFLWAACDDTRTPDFLAVNVDFLEKNPAFVGSASCNRFDVPGEHDVGGVSFALEGDLDERIYEFSKNCWRSNGLFYAVFRTCALRRCEIVWGEYLAADWAMIICMANQGKIHRADRGSLVLGVNGLSMKKDFFARVRSRLIEYVFPFYVFRKKVVMLSSGYPLPLKIWLEIWFVVLNMRANIIRLARVFR